MKHQNNALNLSKFKKKHQNDTDAGFPLDQGSQGSQGKSGNLLDGQGMSGKLEIFWKKVREKSGKKIFIYEIF